MRRMQVRRRDLHLPSAPFAVLLARMKRSLISHPVKILAGLFCLSAQLAGRAQSPPTNLWMLRVSDYLADSSPAVAADGTIYQASFAGKMWAITPQGNVKWVYKINSEIKSSPAIADDGTIYFGACDRKFYAVTPRGKLKWSFPTGAWVDSSPAIAGDGTIYFGSWDANFYALNPDGSKKWVFATSNIVVSSPAIGKDGTIYFGSHDKKFYALKPDGKLLWSFTTGAPSFPPRPSIRMVSFILLRPMAILRIATGRLGTVAVAHRRRDRVFARAGRKRQHFPVGKPGQLFHQPRGEKSDGSGIGGRRLTLLLPLPRTVRFISPCRGDWSPFNKTAPNCGMLIQMRILSHRRRLAAMEPSLSATAHFYAPSIPPTDWRRRRKVRGRCSARTRATRRRVQNLY